MNKKIIFRTLIIFIFFIRYEGVSQNFNSENYKELVVAPNCNFPLGKLKWVYGPALGLQVGFNWVEEDYDHNNIIKKGFNLGALQFKPKEDTLYYLVPPDSYGTAMYSNYNIVSLTAHIEKIRTFGKFGLIAGVDAGLAFVEYSSIHKDKNFDSGEDSFEGKFILCPQVGFNYDFAENINVSVLSQYNGLLSLGSTDPDNMAYNTNTGVFTQFVSAYFKVAYAF